MNQFAGESRANLLKKIPEMKWRIPSKWAAASSLPVPGEPRIP